jgi:hypothetical protein
VRPGVRRYFHHTSAENALAILRDGFKNGRGYYGTTQRRSGVWLSAEPLTANEGAAGDVVLTVRLPVGLFEDYEWVEQWKWYREALIPAAKVNRLQCGVRIVAVDCSEEDMWRRRGAMWRQGLAAARATLRISLREDGLTP